MTGKGKTMSMGKWIYIEDEEYEPEDDRDIQSAEDWWEDEKERRLEELDDLAARCKCGAWQTNLSGKVIHVADCCCGAE